MKAIPEQLRAYFPNVTDPARPWWTLHPVMFLTQRQRVGGIDPFTCREDEDRELIDKRDPLPPPPILVGQVWAQPNNDGGMLAAQVSAVTYESDGTVTVHWVSGHVATDDVWLYLHGFLLRGDYAPWSGPEIL